MASPGAAVKAQMRKRRATIRDIARESATLAADDKDTYTAISKSLLHEVVKPGYINAKRPTAAFFNTLIQILWDGDWRAFDQDMHFAAPHTLRTSNNHAPTPTATVPHYLEGENPRKQAQPRTKPTCAGTDFLFTLRSNALAPIAAPHATLHCRRLNDTTPLPYADYAGRAIIYRQPTGTLHAAWLSPGPRLLIDGNPHPMPARNRIVGIAEWTAPHLPKASTANRPATTPQHKDTESAQVSMTFPIPADLHNHLRRAARERGTSQKTIFANAIQVLLDEAETNLDVIPPTHLLERPRDDGINTNINHEIPKPTRDRLANLADRLGTQRQQRIHQKDLAILALRRTLTPSQSPEPTTTPPRKPK